MPDLGTRWIANDLQKNASQFPRQLGREHPGAWRSCADNRVLFQLDYYQKIAQTAERGLFDAVFYASGLALQESPGRPPTPGLDPVVLCSALAASTERIGFVVTVSTTFNEPYNVAKTMASLDHLSRGRAAWDVVTTYDERAALNFGMKELPPKTERYERANEFVEVVLKLWDSWDPDPFLRVGGSTVVNKAAVHRVDHVGKYYDVRGPAQLPRSPQRRPVLFQAGLRTGQVVRGKGRRRNILRGARFAEFKDLLRRDEGAR